MKSLSYFRFFLLIFPFILGCSSSSKQLNQYEKIANQINTRIGEKYKKEKGLTLALSGGRITNEVELMAIGFNSSYEVDLNTARELIVDITNEYLIEINNSQKIKPYLHKHPFTSKDVDVRVFFLAPSMAEPSLTEFCCVSSRDGIIRYYIRSIPDHPLIKETFYEAQNELAYLTESGQLNQIRYKGDNEVAVCEVIAEDGAKAKMTVSSFKGSIYQLRGEGFKPNETMNFISNSSDEILYYQVEADENGDLPFISMLPAVEGQRGGIWHLDILRDDSPLQIKLPWGIEAFIHDGMSLQDNAIQKRQ